MQIFTYDTFYELKRDVDTLKHETVSNLETTDGIHQKLHNQESKLFDLRNLIDQ